MATDIVCGAEIEELIAEHKYDYQGKIYFFCSPRCKTEFDTNPERYIGEEVPEAISEKQGQPWWKFW